MWSAITPPGASFDRYSASASFVIRWIGIASELKASSTITPYVCGSARASDSRPSPIVTAHASPQARR